MPTGPDFFSLQVGDLDASATFYEEHLGLRRAPSAPPGGVLFPSEPIPFAIREVLPGVDLDAAQPGLGITLWFRVDDSQALHDRLAETGVTIKDAPYDSPFGRAFAIRDLDGYVLNFHDGGQ